MTRYVRPCTSSCPILELFGVIWRDLRRCRVGLRRVQRCLYSSESGSAP